MLQVKSESMLMRFADAELNLCRSANRVCRVRSLRWLFAWVSRLGDGVFWYLLMLLLPLIYGRQAVSVSLRMLGVATVGVGVYKLVKSSTARPRPCTASGAIELGAAPLDRYSFPSGHTLHAVSFTVVATAYYPELWALLAPFSVLVALSRVILGLHYPTDVVSGALIGFAIATVGLSY